MKVYTQLENTILKCVTGQHLLFTQKKFLHFFLLHMPISSWNY